MTKAKAKAKTVTQLLRAQELSAQAIARKEFDFASDSIALAIATRFVESDHAKRNVMIATLKLALSRCEFTSSYRKLRHDVNFRDITYKRSTADRKAFNADFARLYRTLCEYDSRELAESDTKACEHFASQNKNRNYLKSE
jgi:hypothetical protein